MSDEVTKQASVAADPANQEALLESVATNMEKDLPTFVVKGGGLWELWASTTELSQYRLNRYRDYDDMSTDSLIASALELVSDDAVQYSADRGAQIWPSKGSDEKWVEAALKTLKVEENIWGWAHNTAMYGDFLPQFLFEKDEKEKSGLKFKALDSSVHPKDVRRLDVDGNLVGFLTQEEFSKVVTHAPWEFVHFMLNNRPRFERHRLRIKGHGPDYTPSRDSTKKANDVVATSMYGSSWLDPCRSVYRILKLLEQALSLARLNRSPMIRVFYVNTTGLTPKERKNVLDDLHLRFKENLSMDMRQNFYKSDYNPLSFNADLFIPVTDGVGQMTAETLGGELNIKDIVDVDYHRNKLFAALRIPQAYLGFEEAMPGTIGSTTLVRLDIRYARGVKKLQRSVLSGVTRLLEVMYAVERGEKPDAKKISLEMEIISGVEELDRMEALERKLGVAAQFLQMATELDAKMDTVPLIKYIFDSILGLKHMTDELKIGVGGTPPEVEAEESTLTPAHVSGLMMEAMKEGRLDPSILMTLIGDQRKSNYFMGAGRTLESDFTMPSPERRTEYDFLEDVIREPSEEVTEIHEGENRGNEEV